MTVIPDRETFERATTRPEDRCKIARNDFIEAYNQADAAVRDVLIQMMQTPRRNLSDNLNALEDCDPTSVYPKKSQTRVHKRIAELRHIAAMRADIVHGEMTFIGDEPLMMFANVQDRRTTGRYGLLLTNDELANLIRQLRGIAASLRSCVGHHSAGDED